MATIKVTLRLSSPGALDGEICYRIAHSGTVRMLHPGYSIAAAEWDARHSSIKMSTDPSRCEYLQSIDNMIRWDMEHFRRTLAKCLADNIAITAENLLSRFSKALRDQSFFRFMESIIVRLKRNGRLRTSETYTTALNSFKRFLCGRDLRFEAVDADLMESYEFYLSSRGLVPNSISFHMRILRAVFNRAVEKKIISDNRPFSRVYTGVDRTAKRALSLKTLRKISSVDLSGCPKASYARDMFLLSYFLRGMSFIDMAYLRKTDLRNGILVYRRRKTGQRLAIKWTREMQKLLDAYPENETDYLFPIITSATSPERRQAHTRQYQINRGLKDVAVHIGLSMPLTLYCSRHTWASIAKSEGIPLGVISDGLGHDSEKTTRIYLANLDTEAVDIANDHLIHLL